MALNPQEELYLIDKNGQRLGSVAIRRIEAGRLYGRFLADKGFATVGCLFERDGYKKTSFARFTLDWIEGK